MFYDSLLTLIYQIEMLEQCLFVETITVDVVINMTLYVVLTMFWIEMLCLIHLKILNYGGIKETFAFFCFLYFFSVHILFLFFVHILVLRTYFP
jgi:hypothetical protein